MALQISCITEVFVRAARDVTFEGTRVFVHVLSDLRLEGDGDWSVQEYSLQCGRLRKYLSGWTTRLLTALRLECCLDSRARGHGSMLRCLVFKISTVDKYS
jgi:hypothetical protein